MTDAEFVAGVKLLGNQINLAPEQRLQPWQARQTLKLSLAAYMWETTESFKRLSETDAGKLLGEFCAPVPCPVLRELYRKKLLAQ